MSQKQNTPLQLFNTLTKRKEVFEPINAQDVRMYVCGPTVYDFAHIGNARPVIVFDVLFRLLRYLYGADHVTYVRNITDVDDKINARALRDYPDLPLNEAIRAVTEKTANQFHADVAALGCLPPTHEPRATEFVLPRADGKADMVTLIAQLLEKEHAYIVTGDEGREVLFDVTSMAAYGALSNRKLEDQQAGARVEAKSHKRNAGDFVLWKESSPEEPGWDATFNGETIRGRPGWHIECSAMSAAYLGKTFDIHGGGLDLIFPHHENEIAQSCCAHGTDKMANIWMHNGYLQVEGKKMSKSDGNFVTIHDLLHTEKFGGRKWPGEVLRLAMLMTHYREPIDFSVRRLEEAYGRWSQFKEYASLGPDYLDETNRSRYETEFDPYSEFLSPLLDDLNFSASFAKLNRLIESEKGDPISAWRFFRTLNFLGLLSFDEMAKHQKYDEPTAVTDYLNVGMLQKKIDLRLAFLADKNFAEADRIRDELLEQGIQLKDSKDSETGERITTWEVKR